MTITDKWSLMLTSFADIKAAVEEMGGSVGTGYASYAKGVRSIYSSESYTPQYTYPERSEMYMQYIFSQIMFCAAVKEEIRLAIVDGGVDCDETVPLSEYGDKIRQINLFGIITTELPQAEYSIPYTAQLEAKGGTPPYTWEFTSGIMPPGITINADGTITGTPTQSGYYTYMCITCTDSVGKSETKKFKLLVSPRKVHIERVGSSTFTYDGDPHTLDLRCVEVPELELIVRYGSEYLAAPTEATSYYATISSGNGNYSIIKDKDYYLWIEPMKVTITHTSPQIYTYDGEQHAYEYVAFPEYAPIIKYKPYSSSDNLTSPSKDSGYTETPPSEVGKYRVWFSAADNNHTISDGSNQSPWYVFGVIEIKEELDNV